MIRVLWAEPLAGAAVQPRSGAFGLFGRHFQALFPPYPFNTLVVHSPPLVSEQRRDPAKTIGAILARQHNNVFGEHTLVSDLLSSGALCGSRLDKNPVRPALGDAQGLLNALDSPASPGRADQFPEMAPFWSVKIRCIRNAGDNSWIGLEQTRCLISPERTLVTCSMYPCNSGSIGRS